MVPFSPGRTPFPAPSNLLSGPVTFYQFQTRVVFIDIGRYVVRLRLENDLDC